MTFTHLLLEAKSKYSQNLKPYSRTHDILESVEGFSHIAFNYNTFPPIRIKTKPMIFILRRKDAYSDEKLKYIRKKEIELLPSDTEELPVDNVLQTDEEKNLLGKTEDALELDDRLEPPDELPQISSDADDDYDDVFVMPVIEDNEDEHQQSPLIDLNIEPTEDIEEEMQLSKLMRMSKEELIKELKRAENKARIYPKSGTVRRNIKKIISEYNALEDGKQVKAEGSTHADLPSADIKHDESVQEQEPQLPTVSEENDSEIHADSEQVTKKPVLEKHKTTRLEQNTDHAALPAQVETPVSSLSFDNVTNEEHHVQKGKKAIKKVIKKYKMLDQNMDEESPMVVDNMTDHVTVQRKKSTKKIKSAKQTFKTDVLEERTDDFETIGGPQEVSVPTANQTIQKEKTEVKDGDKIMKGKNKIVSETNKAYVLDNDVTVSDENVEDSENGTTENGPASQTSERKIRKPGKKVVKDTDTESYTAQMRAADELQDLPLPTEETPTSKIRRKSAERKTNKDKLKNSGGIQHIHVPSEHINKADDLNELNVADAYEQEKEIPVLEDRYIDSETRIHEVSAEKIPVKNEIQMQGGEVSDVINLETHAQHPEGSVGEINKPTKETVTDAIHPEEMPFGVSGGPEGLSSTRTSTELDERNRPISEPSEEKISKQKAASLNTETIHPVLQDEHSTENDKTVEYDDAATRKLGEEVIQI